MTRWEITALYCAERTRTHFRSPAKIKVKPSPKPGKVTRSRFRALFYVTCSLRPPRDVCVRGERKVNYASWKGIHYPYRPFEVIYYVLKPHSLDPHVDQNANMNVFFPSSNNKHNFFSSRNSGKGSGDVISVINSCVARRLRLDTTSP